MQKDILKLDYYTKEGENIKIYYSDEQNIFYNVFEEKISNHNKEWFSRVVSGGNTILNRGIPYSAISFRVTKDTEGTRTVTPTVNVNKTNIPFFYGEDGILYILNKKKNGYFPAIFNLEKLQEIYNELLKIVENEKNPSSEILTLDNPRDK